MGKCEPWDIHMYAMFWNPSQPWCPHLSGFLLLFFLFFLNSFVFETCIKHITTLVILMVFYYSETGEVYNSGYMAS